MNTDQFVERDGGASGPAVSCQSVSHPWMCRWIKRTMLKAALAVRRVLLDVKLSKQIQYCQFEAMKCSANKIGEVTHQYEDYTGTLWDRDKCIAKHLSVIRRGRKMRPLRILTCVWQRSHLKKRRPRALASWQH